MTHAALLPFRIVWRRSAAALITSDWTRFAPDLAAATAAAEAAIADETGGAGVLILVQPTADPRAQAPRPATFDDWRKSLDLAFLAATGLDLRDMPDCPFSDWYEDGLGPEDAVELALVELEIYG